MKTIKKVTALLLSMVLLFSFVVTHALAISDTFAALPSSEDRITINFIRNGVEIDSYAEAYCTGYYAEDCDLGVKTYVTNQYFGQTNAASRTTYAYVELTVMFETGAFGTVETIAKCEQYDQDAVVRAFGMRVVDVEPDDFLVRFDSTHMVIVGPRVDDPLTHPYCLPDASLNRIYLFNMD